MKRLIQFMINLFIALFWMLLMLSFSGRKTALLTFIAAVIHEIGHISVLALLKGEISIPRPVASGMRIKTRSHLSYAEENAVALGGPMTNLLLFVFLFPLAKEFAIVNLATALSNLLPINGYDGHKLLANLLSLVFGSEISDKTMPHIALFVTCTVIFLSLFIILRIGGGYWIFFVFFALFIRQILFFQKQTKNEIS